MSDDVNVIVTFVLNVVAKTCYTELKHIQYLDILSIKIEKFVSQSGHTENRTWDLQVPSARSADH